MIDCKCYWSLSFSPKPIRYFSFPCQQFSKWMANNFQNEWLSVFLSTLPLGNCAILNQDLTRKIVLPPLKIDACLELTKTLCSNILSSFDMDHILYSWQTSRKILSKRSSTVSKLSSRFNLEVWTQRASTRHHRYPGIINVSDLSSFTYLPNYSLPHHNGLKYFHRFFFWKLKRYIFEIKVQILEEGHKIWKKSSTLCWN